MRFSGFDDEWKSFKLSEISKRITRKNKSLETDRPLTISAQYGLVDQIEYFNKIVASKSLKGYYLLNKGEFAYNKSYSNGYPFGAVKRLDDYENGAISTLYICFNTNDKMNSDLLKEYFETDKWHEEIYKIAVEGARNHGLLNVAVGDFFNTKHVLPTNNHEQEKIAKFLIEINTKIDLLENKHKAYQDFKKYLMQKIFAQELRFADDENWVTVTIANIFDNITDYVAAGSFADIRKNVTYLKDPDYAQLIRTADLKSNFTNGDFVYVDKHAFEYLWRVNLDEPCIVLPNIGNIGEVYYINPKELPYSNNALAPNAILLKSNDNIKFKYYLLESPYFKNQLDIINEAGGRGKFNKTNLKKIKIKVPNNDLEKEKIAKCLSNVDNKLKLFNIQLIEMQEFKKGLLQQMFVVQLILSLLQNKKHI